MKLEKYVDKSDKRRKTILITISAIVLISISFLLYKTFASFTESAEFPIMNGKVDYFGNSDIYFVFYKGEEEQLEEMPQKGNEENLVFDYGECDNGATIEWNNEAWAPLVKGLNKVKTKCSLYFEEYDPNIAGNYITDLAKTDLINIRKDDTSDINIRYIGASPNNYIDIGDGNYGSDLYYGYNFAGNIVEFTSLAECQNKSTKDCTLGHSTGDKILWRVIGVMNNITNLDNGGQEESLVKIIRADNIGFYSWDSSPLEVNSGYGVNEWSDADLMKLLNPQEVYSGTPDIGGSLYWNRRSGSCYNSYKETNTTCDFTSDGMSEDAKNKLAKVRWHTGTFATGDQSEWTAKATYEAERSSHNGKEQCESNGGGTTCNDEVPRTTTWEGYIGLMYPSDYGYAVGGEVRETCLGKSMNSYNAGSCNTNDWLNPRSSVYSWTITPVSGLSNSNSVASVDLRWSVSNNGTDYAGGVFPAAYLKSTTRILSNPKPELEYGSKENPFVLE